MKQIVSNYSYSPTTNVVTLTGVNIEQDQLLLVVAPQVGRTLYNFASVTGVVSAGADTRVTLNASTAGLTTTSPLVIFYDDQGSTQTIAGTVTANTAYATSITGYAGGVGSVTALPVVIADKGIYGGNLLNYNGTNTSLNISVKGIGSASLESATNFPVSGTVTIGSLPAISGTVTVGASSVTFNANVGTRPDGSRHPLSLESGSNYLNARVYPSDILPFLATVTVGNSVTIGSLPAISGTVTANSIFPRVTLIDGSGTVTTADTAITVFASSSTRSYLLVQVTTGSAFVNVGATATTVNGINLTAGQGYSWETTIPQGIVSLISTTTSSRYVAKEA